LGEGVGILRDELAELEARGFQDGHRGVRLERLRLDFKDNPGPRPTRTSGRSRAV
jgi:hypothetical protein